MFSLFGITASNTALAAGPGAINLGTAGNFVILSKTGVSTTGTTMVTGDLGVSPISASAITGFALSLPSASAFSTSAIVTGKIYAPGYADPTPSNLITAIGDMETAYTDGAGRTNPTATELGAGNIGGLTITPGLYKWGTGVIVPSNVTLSGGPNDIWIFQIAQTLDVSSGVNIVLSGGAQANNVYWIVGGQVTIGTTAAFNGNILGKTAIVFNTGASLNGRALAQTAVTLDSNSITKSEGTATVVVPVVEPVVTVTSTSNTNSGTTNPNSPVVTSNTNNQTTTNTPSNTSTNTTSNSNSGTAEQRAALEAQLSVLMAQIQIMQSAQSGANPPNPIKLIAMSLGVGSRGGDVKTLQDFLISLDIGASAKALARVGATSYFGVLTRAALAEFQANVGVNPALGNFGPITRAYIQANY